MGCGVSHSTVVSKGNVSMHYIPDLFSSLEEVQKKMREEGLEECDLIIAVDFTKSNSWNGDRTFGGRCLHHLFEDYEEDNGKDRNLGGESTSHPTKSSMSNLILADGLKNDNDNNSLQQERYPPRKRRPTQQNPYEQVISLATEALRPFDDDQLIPVFGFGDAQAPDIFALFPERPDFSARGLEEVLTRYREAVPKIMMSGPTNFAPVIRKAIEISKVKCSFHILLIIADGEVNRVKKTSKAICEAAEQAPLAIVCVGVGDGPWDVMEKFDDDLPDRLFDNFQFVPFEDLQKSYPNLSAKEFALHCLMEIPYQFRFLKDLGRIED